MDYVRLRPAEQISPVCPNGKPRWAKPWNAGDGFSLSPPPSCHVTHSGMYAACSVLRIAYIYANHNTIQKKCRKSRNMFIDTHVRI